MSDAPMGFPEGRPQAAQEDPHGQAATAVAATPVPPGRAATDMGDMEVVAIDDLNVDHAYQRELDRGLVQKIADTWDIAAAGPIVVSRRADGSLWIVNGQHRAAAAKLAGETEILAQVVNGLDRPAEALLRLKGNTRRGDSSQERFKAQVAAGDPQSMSIVRLLAEYETRINDYPDQKRGVNCVAAVEHLYKRDKGMLLSRTLDVIKEAWGEIHGPKATTNTLKSIAWFLDKHQGEADRMRLVERLQATGVDQLNARAGAHRAAMGGSMWLNWYKAIVEVYNEKLSQARKLEWKTGSWSRLEHAATADTLGRSTGGFRD